MGKAVFLFIASIMLGATAMMFGGKQSSFESQSEQSEYQATVLARDIAKSGYNEILSTIKREKMSATGSRDDITMLGGTYDQAVTANIYGDLDVEVLGDYNGVGHTISSNVIFASPFPSAIALSDDEVDANGTGSGFAITGIDGRAPSRGTGGGFLRPTNAIVTDDIHEQSVSSNFAPGNVTGTGNEDGTAPTPSVEGGFTEAVYEAIYQEAMLKPYTSIAEGTSQSIRQSLLQSAASSSSPDNPKIVRARGDMTINYPVEGHGLLIVEDGDLTVIGSNFDWEGLVMVRKENVDTVRVNLSTGAKIHGGFVGYSVPGGGAPTDCDPDFDIDGNEVVPSDSVRLKFTVLGAAISASGQYDMPVTVKISIDSQNYYPFGSYTNALSGNVNTGNSGTIYSWEPTGVYPPDTRITIGGRSWIKKKWWYSGNSSWHWKTHMEKADLTVDDQLSVLRDGDPVPSVGGYLGQYSVEDFLAGYIDTAADEVTLEETDAIYLYELGMSNPSSSAHDMQDLVVLISMTSADPACEGGIAGTSRIEFDMSGTAKVRYSAEALAKLGKTLDTIADNTQVVVSRDESISTHTEGAYGQHKGGEGEEGEGEGEGTEQ